MLSSPTIIMNKLLIVIPVLFLSCNDRTDSFYSTSHTEDIDILPLIKPYRLWSPIPDEHIWHLEFKGRVKNGNGYYTQTNVCNINVLNNHIFGHCDSRDCYPNFYFVIVPDSNIEVSFENRPDWVAYLSSRHIDSVTFDVLSTYNSFKRNRNNLPWLEEISVP